MNGIEANEMTSPHRHQSHRNYRIDRIEKVVKRLRLQQRQCAPSMGHYARGHQLHQVTKSFFNQQTD